MTDDQRPDSALGSPSDDLGTSSDEFDLTPRTTGVVRPARRNRAAKRWVGVGVVALVLVFGGVAVVQALNDAALFFRNVDEAVAQRDVLGDTRFRIQGTVVPDSIDAYPGGAVFEITYNGVSAEVEHTGDPQELFQPDIPVVLEGSWTGSQATPVFVSDRMLVKHDENYEADNAERIDEAEDGYDDSYDDSDEDDGGDEVQTGRAGAGTS